jgi:DNA-binding GntR family transcriptional regulator
MYSPTQREEFELSPSDLSAALGRERERQRPTLRSARVGKVYEALLAAILDHRLTPGTRLPEDEIGTVFGASRTLVRAALQALAHERLVTIEPNRGAQVAQPTIDEARQVFEARSLIEPRTAALAAGRAAAHDVARLQAHLQEENRAIAASDQGRAIALSAAFHVMIAELADQPILASFVRELVSRSSLVVALYWRRSDATCERHAHHELVAAIEARSSERAADLMRSHLVDILSGLDLVVRHTHEVTLAELLLT